MATPVELDDDGLPIRLRKQLAAPAVVPRIKIVSCGDPAVGKSCLIKRFCEKRFVSKYVPTIGVDFGVTQVKVDSDEGPDDIKVSFYDLAGDPMYEEVRSEFFGDTQGLLLVFDTCNVQSFRALNGWLDEVRREVDIDRVCVAVCATKVDHHNGRAVPEAEARLWASQKGFHYYEVSALADTAVDAMFKATFEHVLAAFKGGEVDRPAAVMFTQKHIDAIDRVMAATTDVERLGTSQSPSKEEINKAYKRMVTLLHPDKNHAPGSEDAFKKLTASRTKLLNDLKR